MPLAWHIPPTDTPGPRTLAAAGVMINTQDPLLNFPASVNFSPYAYFRNISAAAKTLRFTIYYMPGRTAASLSLPDLTLQPGEAEARISRISPSHTPTKAIGGIYWRV